LSELYLVFVPGQVWTAPIDQTETEQNDTAPVVPEGFGKPAKEPQISDHEQLAQMAYEQSLIDMYFGTMDAKPVPVYLCEDVESFAYRMPAPVSCPLIDLDKPSKGMILMLLDKCTLMLNANTKLKKELYILVELR